MYYFIKFYNNQNKILCIRGITILEKNMTNVLNILSQN